MPYGRPSARHLDGPSRFQMKNDPGLSRSGEHRGQAGPTAMMVSPFAR